MNNRDEKIDSTTKAPASNIIYSMSSCKTIVKQLQPRVGHYSCCSNTKALSKHCNSGSILLLVFEANDNTLRWFLRNLTVPVIAKSIFVVTK